MTNTPVIRLILIIMTEPAASAYTMTAATAVHINSIRVTADVNIPHHRQAGSRVHLHPLVALVISKRTVVLCEEIAVVDKAVVHKTVVVLLQRLRSR